MCFKSILTLGSWVKTAFIHGPKIASSPSRYPELPRKTWWQRYWDICWFRAFRGFVCHAYNALGIDLVGHDIRDYITEQMIFKILEPFSHLSHVDYTVLLLDKYLFETYLSIHGVPVARSFAHSVGGEIYDSSDKYVQLSVFLQRRCPRWFVASGLWPGIVRYMEG